MLWSVHCIAQAWMGRLRAGVPHLPRETTSKVRKSLLQRLLDAGVVVARALFTGPFLDDAAGLPDYVLDEVRDKCAMAEEFPGIGSALVELSLRRSYGSTCLKLAAAGYDVLYERLDEQDAVVFLGIVPQRKVR